MVKPNHKLTKTCGHCRLQKPLSAFLQLDQQGTTYGNICATCRKTNLEKPSSEEESSRSSTGVKYDAKTKVQKEKIKKETLAERKLLTEEHEKKEIEQTIEQTQKIETSTKDAKKHQTSFLKGRGFLTQQSKSSPQRHQNEFRQQIFQQEVAIEKARQQDQIAKEEQKQADLDMSGDDMRMGKEKYNREGFRRYMTLIGEGSAFGRNLAQAQKKPAMKREKTEKETIDHINKTWGPNQPPRKRR